MKEYKKKWLKTPTGREYKRRTQQKYRQRKAEKKRINQLALINNH